MRILQIVPTLAVGDGGPAETLKGLVPALSEIGVDCRVLTTDKGGRPDESAIPDVEFARAFPPRSLTLAPGLVPLVRRAVKEADVVHVHGYPTFPTSVGLRSAGRLGRPVLLQPHGSFDEYQWRQHSFRKHAYALAADGRRVWAPGFPVLVSSRLEAQGARAVLPRCSVHVSPLGVDDVLFNAGVARARARKWDDASTLQILFLGRVAAKKRLDLLVAALGYAASSASARRICLTVAGPIAPGLGYEARGLDAGLPGNLTVNFMGPVERAERPKLLEAADIFVLPSEDESFGIAAAEAMAAGCPTVLTTGVGLAPDAYSAGACQITELDAKDLARVIGQLGESASLRQEIGDRAAAYARANFRWVTVAKGLAAIYDKLAISARRV